MFECVVHSITHDHVLMTFHGKNVNMRILASTLCAVIFAQCTGLNLIDVPEIKHEDTRNPKMKTLMSSTKPYPPVKTTSNDVRRYWLVSQKTDTKEQYPRTGLYEDEKDENLKTKISTLVQQTMHDCERKVKSVQYLKDRNRQLAPYRAGFILSMVKKTRDVLNELFNVAVKHRDEWKALEQLKIFELIVHTNVDTTNLVRQLVEIHIQHLNATSSNSRRVVLL